ncbi:MAG: oligosaccharide flippase family protein [Cryomorphaceae bacterium]|nr:oligosaccharide flippase family protein [Cryomorphaceae bacterium]
MQRKFLSGITFFFVLNILIKPLWVFGIDMAVQNRVGADVYGSYFALLNLTLMFAILLDLGINMSNTRNVAGNENSIRDFFPSLFFLRIILLILFSLVVGAVGIALGYEALMIKWLAWMIFNQFLFSFLMFIRSYVGGLQWFNWDAFLSVADKLLMVIILGFALYTPFIKGDFRIEYLIGGQTAAYSIAIITGVLVIRKKLPELSWKFDSTLIKQKLREALPYATLILVMGLYTRLDGVMIERLRGSNESGMYAGAFRLLDIAIQMGVLYSFVLIPVFTKKLQSRAFHGTLIRASFNLLLSISLSATVLVTVFNQELVHLFYLHATTKMGLTLAVLMASLPAFYLGYLFGSALTAGGKTKILNRIAVGGLLMNFTLNLLFIPKYGEIGAALTTLITQWLAAALQMWAAKKVFKITIARKQFIALMWMVIIQFVVYMSIKTVAPWGVAVIVGGLISMATPFALRLVSPAQLKQIRT